MFTAWMKVNEWEYPWYIEEWYNVNWCKNDILVQMNILTSLGRAVDVLSILLAHSLAPVLESWMNWVISNILFCLFFRFSIGTKEEYYGTSRGTRNHKHCHNLWEMWLNSCSLEDADWNQDQDLQHSCQSCPAVWLWVLQRNRWDTMRTRMNMRKVEVFRNSC